ncbi:hypothetical protein RSOLAG1IB_06175 [Rhizoctonia solani AG-1 IB]|uniref:Peptidase C14 caspase domain-containing protein n=1 Tax=Thanatephorus cucumeris (strain AG1-IB / isolate 7/3/14) TaxID=1108050 RepID=A0A0B7F8J3_THACB|nr:hypothetical protein RSOLAG1IB_06175 [Rhizoctonia solani AG-1 IB]
MVALIENDDDYWSSSDPQLLATHPAPCNDTQNSGLLAGLYGTIPSVRLGDACALVITIDYKTSPRDYSDWANKPGFTLTGATGDCNAVQGILKQVGLSTEHIKCLSNEEATHSNINRELSHIYRLSKPATVYIQGHGLMLPYKRFEFLPHDYYISDPPRGIECYDLRSNLSLWQGQAPAQRLIITDLCYGYNFNRLPYVLTFGIDGPYWGISDEWQEQGYQPSFSNTVLHFAAGSFDEVTYENSVGGFFTQVACKVMKEPRTLPDLLMRVRAGVCERIHSYSDKFSQTPQLYASHELDLYDKDVLQLFGWFGPMP